MKEKTHIRGEGGLMPPTRDLFHPLPGRTPHSLNLCLGIGEVGWLLSGMLNL